MISKVRKLRKVARLAVRYLKRVKRKMETPIIVYQMGKVGSRSVKDSLRAYELDRVFHVHRMNPINIERVRQEYLAHGETPPDESVGERLYSDVVKLDREAKFITLVREPISRNMSAFFENFKRFTGVKYENSDFTVEELITYFIEGYRHSVPLTWFDVEMKPTLDINVYAYPFPTDEGYTVIKDGSFEILILKLEINDETKEAAIAEFLDMPDFQLSRSNVGQDKDYARTYQHFLRTIKLPRAYVDLMCDSQYTKHFYSAAEIEAVRSEWRDRTSKVELPPTVQQTLVGASDREIDWL